MPRLKAKELKAKELKAKELKAYATLFGPKFARWAKKNPDLTNHFMRLLRIMVEAYMAGRFHKLPPI